MAVILVTDGEQRVALAVVRSLGAAGHEVYVASDRKSSLAGASRYVRATAHVPNALEQPMAYAAAVEQLVRSWNVEVLLANTDASLLALLPLKNTLPAVLPFGSLDNFQRISDKAKVADVSRTIGIGVPMELRLDSRAAAMGIDARALAFPLVLKPARSVLTSSGRRSKLGVTHIADPHALAGALEQLPPEAYPILLQERIEGYGVGVFLMLHDHEVVAAFSHRRLREKPPSGGVSVLRESIPLDPRLLALSVELLRSFEWEGPAMVEYKVDARGTAYIMEINARFWGSLQLAIDAGVDFPALLVDVALNKAAAPILTYRYGVRSRWLLGDVDHLLLRLRHGDRHLALAPNAPRRARVCFDFLRAFGPRTRGEVFRLEDPGPAVREARDWLRGR